MFMKTEKQIKDFIARRHLESREIQGNLPFNRLDRIDQDAIDRNEIAIQVCEWILEDDENE